ncbi:MAG: hypothetical protein ABR562_06930 [Thermoplasmatota archaeon]
MKGEFVHMSLFDLGAELDLARVHRMLGRPTEPAPLVSRSPAPPYAPLPRPKEVRFVPAGGTAQVEVRIHSVGVAAVRTRIPFEAGTVADLARLQEGLQMRGLPLKDAARAWFDELRPDLEPAVVEPYPGIVEPETYFVFCLTDIGPETLLGPQREAVAALIAGEEPGRLVAAVVESALKHTVRYYKDDAVVVGWDHAVVASRAGAYEDILDVLELANLQLLEFRTYDEYLDTRLDESFAALDRLWAPGGLFRSARGALKDISELRVDFARLTDNLQDTGKIFGEWYVAKLHQHLREAFHLASWERAVAGKMQTLEDMFQLAEEEANHRRSLILEILVVMLFILDVALLVLR